jgi:hypothetical protein
MKIDTKKLLEAMFSDASIIGTDLALILLRALGKIGIEFRDGQLIEYRHKPGNWYVCIKDGIFGGFPDGDTHFHKGEVYFCDDKGIVDHYNSNFHEDFKSGDCDENVWDYFCPWSISDAKPGDVLYAESIISDHEDNILINDNGALYVSGAQIEQNKADIAALGDRMDAAEADIDALEDGLAA